MFRIIDRPSHTIQFCVQPKIQAEWADWCCLGSYFKGARIPNENINNIKPYMNLPAPPETTAKISYCPQ